MVVLDIDDTRFIYWLSLSLSAFLILPFLLFDIISSDQYSDIYPIYLSFLPHFVSVLFDLISQ